MKTKKQLEEDLARLSRISLRVLKNARRVAKVNEMLGEHCLRINNMWYRNLKHNNAFWYSMLVVSNLGWFFLLVILFN